MIFELLAQHFLVELADAGVWHALDENDVVGQRHVVVQFVGVHVSWPNAALCSALMHDSDSDIRLASFEAMLHLHAVPRSTILSLVDKLSVLPHLLNIEDLQTLLNEAKVESAFLYGCVKT